MARWRGVAPCSCRLTNAGVRRLAKGDPARGVVTPREYLPTSIKHPTRATKVPPASQAEDEGEERGEYDEGIQALTWPCGAGGHADGQPGVRHAARQPAGGRPTQHHLSYPYPLSTAQLR